MGIWCQCNSNVEVAAGGSLANHAFHAELLLFAGVDEEARIAGGARIGFADIADLKAGKHRER